MITTHLYIVLDGSEEYEDVRAYGLIPVIADFPRPTPKIEEVKVLGADGSLDLSGALSGIRYDRIKATIKFVSAYKYGRGIDEMYYFLSKYNGKVCKVLVPGREPYEYFRGRLWVEEDDQRDNLPTLTMSMLAEPWKYAVDERTATLTTGTETPLTTENCLAIEGLSGYGTFFGVVDGAFKAMSISTAAARETAKFKINIGAKKSAFLTFKYYMGGGDTVGISISGKGGKTYFSDSGELGRAASVRVESGQDGFVEITMISTIAVAGYGYGMYDLRLFEQSTAIVENGGEKTVIPSYRSEIDCMIINGRYSVQLAAGSEGTLWEFPLYAGENSCVIVPASEQTGNVTLKWREGRL